QTYVPSSKVPLAKPIPGPTARQSCGPALGQVPPLPLGAAAGAVALGVAAVRWRRSRPATWAEAMARRIERAGRRAGRPRRSAETIAEYGAALDRLSEEESGRWREFAAAVQSAGYGGRAPSGETQR